MSETISPVFWVGFLVFIGAMLTLDLFVFHRKPGEVTIRSAALTSAFWISLGIGFGIIVLLWLGPEKSVEYFSGYLIEESLSVDNVFVFSLVFAAFAIPGHLQYRVLFWGVIGALGMRLVMIVVGAALLQQFEWILLVFGGFLVFTGIRMWRSTRSEEEADPANNPIVKFARRRFAFTDRLDGQKFFTRVDAKRMATPLLLALVVVEISDLVFAVDSIPAVFAVTTDPFIVYTSNAFAILGLRSLYFFLADLKDRFRFLTHGLSVVLVFVGVKLLSSPWIHLPPWVSLVVIAAVLGGAIAFSLAHARREERRGAADQAGQGAGDTRDPGEGGGNPTPAGGATAGAGGPADGSAAS
jgi:tellurite resistance protein TerC